MTATREQFTQEELAMVLSHYDLGGVTAVRDFPRGSHASPKAVVTTERGRFLLKRRPVGGDNPYKVAFTHALQNYLAEKNFPLPHLIGTRGGNNSMLKLGQSIYEVYEYIDGRPYDQGLPATREAAKTLALYHRLVQDYEPQWEPPLGHYHNNKNIFNAFKPIARILRETPSARGRGKELFDVLTRLQALYRRAAEAVNRLGLPRWPRQIVHSDWHPGNLLFENHLVVAVLDFDAARIRPRVMDVANGCLQFSFVAGGRDLDAWPPRADADRAHEFLGGYDQVSVLSRAELDAVPHLMQEAAIAQAVPPILKTGRFAGLDGFAFLRVMLAKVQWLESHQDWARLDSRPAAERSAG